MTTNKTISAADDIDADGPGSATTGEDAGGTARAIILDTTTKVAHTTLPSTATWNTLTSWTVTFTVRSVGGTSNKLLYINDTSEAHTSQVNLVWNSSGFIALVAAGGAQIFNTPHNTAAFKVSMSYASGTDKVTLATTDMDGTNSVSTDTAALSKTGGWDWRGLILVLNDSVFLLQNSGALFHCDYLHINLGGTDRLLWEFTDNGTDSSASGINATLLGSPSYEDSPAGG